MQDWDSAQYLKYEAERTQPARDLAAGVLPLCPRRILDAGCGPGNSTEVLLAAFPGTEVVGADSSPAMLAEAERRLPQARFVACDLSGTLAPLGDGYDLVFSNACLQWIGNHTRLFTRLYALLRPGGALAVQVPMQSREHVHTIIGEESSRPPYQAYQAAEPVFHTLSETAYIDLLASLGADFRVWKTVYYHLFPSSDNILDWYRGTGLRPYLSKMPPHLHAGFEQRLMQRLKAAYPPQKNGQVAFAFPRFFMVAKKPKP